MTQLEQAIVQGISNLVAGGQNIRITVQTQLACAPPLQRILEVYIIVSNLPTDLQSPYFNIFKNSLLEQDKPLYKDLGIISQPSIIRKRKRTLSADTAISSIEVLDLTSKLTLEDSYLVKWQRLAQLQAESLISSPIYILGLIPLLGRSSLISPLRTSNNLNTSNLDSGNKDNNANILDLP